MKKIFLVSALFVLMVVATNSYSQVSVEGPVMRIESQSLDGTWIAYDFAATPILDHICGIFYGAYQVYKIKGTEDYYLKPVPEFRQYANFYFCLKSELVHNQTMRLLNLIAKKESGNMISQQTANAFLENLIRVKMSKAPTISIAKLNLIRAQQEAQERKNINNTASERKAVEAELEQIMRDARAKILEEKLQHFYFVPNNE